MKSPSRSRIAATLVFAAFGFACPGLQGPQPGIEIIQTGDGPTPTETDTVLVHYHGTFPDGRVFDSSVQRRKPASFSLNSVIPCWTIAFQELPVGSKARLVCPPELAYGPEGAGGVIPPDATLHFEVELLAIE